MSEQTIAYENKILRGYLRDILDIVGHGSTFSDDCPAEMLAYIVEEVVGEIEDKDKIIAEKEVVFSELRSLNLEQSDRITELESDLAEENKILRGHLRKIDEIVGNDSMYIDDCSAETLVVIVEGVADHIAEKDHVIATMDGLRADDKCYISSLLKDIDDLKADLGECRINLREADAPTDKYGLMLGRIGQMIPVEFFRTPESTVEQAVALLLDRYYTEMATNMYNQNQKLENQ